MKKEKMTISRMGIYLLGIFLVSLGIVLCKKSNLGISPISSIPFVLEEVTPLTFGNLTMLFHFVNTALQILLRGKKPDLKLLLQFALALIFGTVIDFCQSLVVFDNTILINQILALSFSIFFTALGMVCMISMDLIQNPPDGTVKALSQKTGMELGKMKICFDVACVLISTALGLVFLGKPKGFGVATIASALFVGRCVTLIKKCLEKWKEHKKCY